MIIQYRSVAALCILSIVLSIVVLACAGAAAQESPTLPVLHIKDYAAAPITGSATATGNNGSLARINTMREEPGGAKRLFVNDLNGPLYILDQSTKKFTTYLDFDGRDAKTGLFDKLTTAQGYANGFITFQFDPDYARNGKFYTVHLEDPLLPGSTMPNNSGTRGLNLSAYKTTEAIKTPGTIDREAVLIEWTDSNINNATFEGTARELMRLQLNTRIHPMGDLIFNPTAKAGDDDWRVLYIGCGDGGSGENTGVMRLNPQRLDTLVGKILRIIPDLNEHATSSVVSENGRYRIPNDNPFASTTGARKEIWAYGLRNPHRLTWDMDPTDRANNHLLAATVGLHTWESVYVIRKGANYGYSEREGNEKLETNNMTTALPAVDKIPVRINETATEGEITPTYPVLEYPHTQAGGDAIAGGFVYRGKSVPALRGKYVFADITTGRVWYADYAEMLRADDGKPETLATRHEMRIEELNGKIYPTMFPIAEYVYHLRGGKDPDLPGSSTVSGTGRADVRFAVDGSGELYILSKTDGMIRAVVSVSDN